MAEKLKEEGNRAFAQRKPKHAAKLYKKALNENPNDELKCKLHSNLALMYLKMHKPLQAEHYCDAGLALVQGSDSGTVLSYGSELHKKLEFRKGEAKLLAEMKDNYEKSCKVRVESPTVISKGSLLFESLSENSTQSHYFYQSQYITTSETSARFWVTPDVLTCVVVFAIYRPKRGGNLCYAAHVDLDNLSVGVRANGYAKVGHELLKHLTKDQVMAKYEEEKEMHELFKACPGERELCRNSLDGSGDQVLLELKESMASTFPEIDPKEVRVHIVGGHRLDTKYGLCTNVVECVRSLGFSVSTNVANRFEGVPTDLLSQELARIVVEGQQFLVVGFDTHTGCIVTHSDVSAALPMSGDHVEWVAMYTHKLGHPHKLELQTSKYEGGKLNPDDIARLEDATASFMIRNNK